MLNFDYQNRTRIIFGKDKQKEIGAFIKPYANKVLFHYGGQSIKKSGLYQEVVDSLNRENIEFVELPGVQPNPRLSLVYEGIRLCRENGIEFILAVGGGSVLDSSKAIALGVPYDGDVWDYYLTRKEADKVLDVATILTLPATGSESSDSSVITNEEAQLKLGYGSDKIRPLFSVMNPELFFTLPKHQMANGACDMMSHIMERYFTNTLHTDVTDGLCESTLKAIMKNALILKDDMQNYDAWAEVSFAGSIAHNGLLGLGRMQDWACHKMEHELSAIYDVAHGAGLAAVTPSWMRSVYQENIGMFLQFAVNVMGVEASFRDPDAAVLEGIRRLEQFFADLGLPVTLTELGIEEKDYERMAKKATWFDRGPERPIGGLKKLYWQDVLQIYKMAK
ncbi:iron-containing alcohol dehydrogenase [Sinanaerobacter chloroacetimidivorans]|uniref:Iron-containing alcohol dehydrogenase n=1 Tax=Sinanaerobacter chloroacetimidivorans TaxID=2818044 RepID=A0A8J7W1K3_9FIRM|nr:iron-containing alcohol dehydrogenase [Sinanaerobacter chloroacetimidivorans]MBR0598714.1 iron-containing alcohol dehydrogenase [Sinanaerobacter chloroacetimidivorans]